MPITTTDVTGAATIYFTPYLGNQIALYTSGTWVGYAFSEVSIALPAVANKVYDVFVYDSAGVVTLELTVWTNTTTRATALTTQDGVYVKSGSTNKRYLGTVFIDGSTAGKDALGFRYVWNYYNRVSKPMSIFIATGSWTYATATWRQSNADSTNQLNFIVGLIEDQIPARFILDCRNDSNAVFGIGIQFNGTTDPTGGLFPLISPNYAALGGGQIQITAEEMAFPVVGYNYIACLEIVTTSAGTVTFLGNSPGQGGMISNLLC